MFQADPLSPAVGFPADDFLEKPDIVLELVDVADVGFHHVVPRIELSEELVENRL